ncbi:D-hexose-6-phosphate mutarotase [Hydromonas duriensis]|uniref:Glucose-6-phosphate 1-epimerase n=1 Tax=Hydromonas duriensis TaxID=1527608 RepID=A0A4R6YAN6_9BURK|nr:D-hexose-6-phosphate mutarotase [Hydromonas duriensis]TDR32574.1 glucose-6-phosphate 1-epimerase [Hydromonas duriensis]
MNNIQAQTFGGQILRAHLLGKEIFYCPEVLQSAPTPARGGVPVLFPQFGTLGALPKHGFARTLDWQVFSMLEGCVSANLLLTEQENWPHRAQLNVDASVEDEHVAIYFEVRNVGETAFTWTGGLHPYFLVGDVLKTRVEGLLDTPVLDFGAQQLETRDIDQHHPISPSIRLYSPNMNVQLTQSGFDAWQVWNPSAQHALQDIPHADWQRFVCVEPVVLTPKTLAPNETWVGQLTITLIDE